MILSGEKTWELRSKATRHRGPLGLIRKGSCCVVGVAELVDVCGPFSEEELEATFQRHRASPDKREHKWNVAWILAKAAALANPVPYGHSSQVNWVILAPNVSAAVEAQQARG